MHALGKCKFWVYQTHDFFFVVHSAYLHVWHLVSPSGKRLNITQSRQPMLQITLSLLQLFSPVVLVTLKAKCHPDQRGCEAMSQVPTAFWINLILEGPSGLKANHRMSSHVNPCFKSLYLSSNYSLPLSLWLWRQSVTQTSAVVKPCLKCQPAFGINLILEGPSGWKDNHSPSTRQGRRASGSDFTKAQQINISETHFAQAQAFSNAQGKRARTHSG